MAEHFTQARIRVNEPGANETLLALREHEFRLIRQRQWGSSADTIKGINRRIAQVRRVINEVEATIAEKGWAYTEDMEDTDGELQRSDPEGTGAGPASARRLG